MAANPFRSLADAWDRLVGSDAEPSGLSAWLAGYRARRTFHAATLGPDVQLFGRPVLHVDPSATLQIGSGVRISARAARTRIEVGPGATLQIGSGAVLDDAALLQAYGRVLIGDNASVGFGVAILDDEGVPGHDPAPVLIGAEARIGARATVLRGVRIGRGAVVAAGALVTEDVPAGATVAGVPAVVVKAASAPPAPVETPVEQAAEASPADAKAASAAPAEPAPLASAQDIGAQGDGAAKPVPEADAVIVRPAPPKPTLAAAMPKPTAAKPAPQPVATPAPSVAASEPTEEDDAVPVWPPHAKLRA